MNLDKWLNYSIAWFSSLKKNVWSY
jgi:hypothetical protein